MNPNNHNKTYADAGGTCLQEQGREHYQRSMVCHHHGRMSESVAAARAAIACQADNPAYWIRLGQSLFDGGDLQEGLHWLDKAAQQNPDNPTILEQWVGRRHYLPHHRKSFVHDYMRLGHLLNESVLQPTHYANHPDPHRRLRIGFITAYFRQNSLVYTFEPFLDAYDRQELELTIYAHQSRESEDPVTRRMAGKTHGYRSIWGLDRDQVIDLIQADQIDILIEIGGYVTGHRMDVMVCKPAPIQVDMGYVDTTGLAQIDYRLTDAVRDPWGWDMPYTETSVTLSHGGVCYRPPSVLPVSVLPMANSGTITFGAFHDHLKLNDTVLELWARILCELKDARLLIKCGLVSSDPVQMERVLARCAAVGIDLNRVDTLGWMPHGSHLTAYHQVDMLLDTFPFNGAVMTLEGMWMGVPTLTLAGQTWAGRTGECLLKQVKLEAFVATDEDEYVAKAVAFARQSQELGRIRAGLRELMLASPLCDARGYANDLSQALRHMWYRWCRQQGVTVPVPEPEGLFRVGHQGSQNEGVQIGGDMQ